MRFLNNYTKINHKQDNAYANNNHKRSNAYAKTNHKRTLRGASSFYIVIFTTLLFSVITMSFIRIILSEATKTTNDDLSKSAYDSALAGVEDAKIALTKYHECIDLGFKANNDGGTCEKIIYIMENDSNDCDIVSYILGRNNEPGEVIIRESEDSNASTKMEQAYTCVKMTEETKDYRSQVSSSNRVRLVPLRTKDLNSVKGIAFNWYATTGDKTGTPANLVNYTSATNNIPVVNLDLFQTDSKFTLGELSLNNNDNTGTNHASLMLQPTSGAVVTKISSTQVLNGGDTDNTADKYNNVPVKVACGNSVDFKCKSVIQLPNTFKGTARNEGTFLLRVELPYADKEVDFSVTLCKGDSLDNLCSDDNVITLSGVQAQIDSTGRANDLYRRIETRVELVDTNFPYPEFAIQSTGNTGDAIKKDFWVTVDCWRSDSDGSASQCNDSGDAETGF